MDAISMDMIISDGGREGRRSRRCVREEIWSLLRSTAGGPNLGICMLTKSGRNRQPGGRLISGLFLYTIPSPSLVPRVCPRPRQRESKRYHSDDLHPLPNVRSTHLEPNDKHHPSESESHELCSSGFQTSLPPSDRTRWQSSCAIGNDRRSQSRRMHSDLLLEAS